MFPVIFAAAFTLAQAQPVKKTNPYLPSTKDLPLETTPVQGAEATGTAAPQVGKWIDDNTGAKKPMGQKVKPNQPKIPVGFSASCKQDGKTYQPQDSMYNLCMENHRKSLEKSKDRGERGAGEKLGDKNSELTPGVELKFGDK